MKCIICLLPLLVACQGESDPDTEENSATTTTSTTTTEEAGEMDFCVKAVYGSDLLFEDCWLFSEIPVSGEGAEGATYMVDWADDEQERYCVEVEFGEFLVSPCSDANSGAGSLQQTSGELIVTLSNL